MPSRNVLKVDAPDSYYHVYAHGLGGQAVFAGHDDFEFFITLIKRYLSHEVYVNAVGTPYEKLYESVELLAYCLMGNRFHLLLYQHKAGGMQRLMRGVLTSYSRYVNDKYGRSGPLFESRYKASRLSDRVQVAAVSRYIHRTPKDWRTYPYASAQYYVDLLPGIDWLQTAPVFAHFSSREEYAAFVADTPAAERELDALKQDLADNGKR